MRNSKQTQATTIKTALLAGCRVDSVMAFSFGITRLAAVIKRLRDNGLARYRLPDDWLGGDAEQSLPECCENRPSGLTSKTASTLSARIPITN